MHSLFISNRTRIVLKEITFVLLLHAVDRDEFRKGGTFPYDDDTDVSQEQNKCCSMRWIDLFTELVLQQILKIDSADHLFLRKKKKQARGTHQKSRLGVVHKYRCFFREDIRSFGGRGFGPCSSRLCRKKYRTLSMDGRCSNMLLMTYTK